MNQPERRLRFFFYFECFFLVFPKNTRLRQQLTAEMAQAFRKSILNSNKSEMSEISEMEGETWTPLTIHPSHPVDCRRAALSNVDGVSVVDDVFRTFRTFRTFPNPSRLYRGLTWPVQNGRAAGFSRSLLTGQPDSTKNFARQFVSKIQI